MSTDIAIHDELTTKDGMVWTVIDILPGKPGNYPERLRIINKFQDQRTPPLRWIGQYYFKVK